MADLVRLWLETQGLDDRFDDLKRHGYDDPSLFITLELDDFPNIGIISHVERVALFKVVQTARQEWSKVSERSNANAEADTDELRVDDVESEQASERLFQGPQHPAAENAADEDGTETQTQPVMLFPNKQSSNSNPRQFPSEVGGLRTVNENQVISGIRRPNTSISSLVKQSAKEILSSSLGKDQSRIQVVVRRRPMNMKELNNKETDIIEMVEDRNLVTVLEPRTKVDLTKFVQRHDFVFDHAFDESSSNADIYMRCIRPLFSSLFYEQGKATCFAYGQTGSGKTYTLLGEGESNVEGLYSMAVRELFQVMQTDEFRHLEAMCSFYEIYGGKLFDLLANRRPIMAREDGKQKVNIVGLKKVICENAEELLSLITKGSFVRQTGSTGANSQSSRSHAIMTIDLRSQEGRGHGRISFIDLAGSERGADTYHNTKQTRIEGAEINKSLLALKECIRALDQKASHKPFRGSKLTQVLKESFMGNSRTVMIANVSPNSGACENTLNTLRYAYRVKELKKSAHAKGSGQHSSAYMPHKAKHFHQHAQNQPHKKRTTASSKSPRSRNTRSNGNQRSITKPMLRNASEPSLSRSMGPSVSASAPSSRPPSSAASRHTTNSAHARAGQRRRRQSRGSSNVPPREREQRSFLKKNRNHSPNYDIEILESPRLKHVVNPRKGNKLSANRLHARPTRKPALSPGSHESSVEEDELSSRSRRHEHQPTAPSKHGPPIISRDQMIRSHRKHIDELMVLLKEDMKLLKDFDGSKVSATAYRTKLRELLTGKLRSVQELGGKLESFS